MAARIPNFGLDLTTTKGSSATPDKPLIFTSRQEHEKTAGIGWGEPALILEGKAKAATDIADYLKRTFELSKAKQ